MDKINFTQQDNFPFTIKSADFMQNMMLLLSKTIALGGNNYVLTGCTEDNANNVTDGYVVVNNELMPFKGGLKKDKIVIIEDRETVSAFGTDYPDAYISRYATFADTGDLNWADFGRIVTNQELWQHINGIKGDPPGIRVGWCGYLDKVPLSWMLCDGRALSIDEYPELFQNIGTQFGSVGTTQFKLPDMRERFVVGHSGNGDYRNVGSTGGKDEVVLTTEELPEHNHNTDKFFNKLAARADDVDATNTPGSVDGASPAKEYRVGGMSSLQWEAATIKSVGKNKAHENRPPFFVEAFIIKVKY